MSQASFADESGIVRLKGTLTGGGGAQPIGHGLYSNTPQVITAGSTVYMNFPASSGPDELLDRTNPAAPTVLASGVYAVSVEVNVDSPMTAGSLFQVLVSLGDSGGINPASQWIAPCPQASISAIWYVPAGETIGVGIYNGDPADVSFDMYTAVQRLSGPTP